MIRSSLLVATLSLLVLSQSALAADGKALYQTTCIACHGAKAEGSIPGVPNLATGMRLAQPDAVLVDHILKGFQTKGSPMAMPPKGGNPNLTADDAKAILTYLRGVTAVAAPPPAQSASAAPKPAAIAPDPSPVAHVADVALALAPAPAPAVVNTASDQSAVPAPQPDMTAFARGAKAWGDNCSRCHNMRDPKGLSDRDWKVVTTHMRLRAGLDGEQVRDITLFLQGSN